MRKPIFTACIALFGLGLATSQVLAVASSFPLSSRATAGFYSNFGVPPMQDPSGFGYTPTAIGPYTHFTPLLGATPASPLYPVYGPLSAGGNFQVAGGITNTFTDGLPVATQSAGTSTIEETSLPIATNLEDFSVYFTNWRVQQAAAAPGYVINQLNFASTYNLNAGASLGVSGAPIPLFVSGKFGPTGSNYAQFEAVMEYTYTPFNSTAGNFGVPIPLGDIRYTFDAATPNLPFFFAPTIVTDSLTPLPFQPNAGVLEIHGYAWVAGDPFDLTVGTLPEPTSAVALFGFSLMLRRRRK